MKVAVEKTLQDEVVVLTITEENLETTEAYETESRLLKNQNIRFVIEGVNNLNAEKLSRINKKYKLTKLKDVRFLNCEFKEWNTVSEIFNRLRNNTELSFTNCVIPEFNSPNHFIGLKVNPILEKLSFKFCNLSVPEDILAKFTNLKYYSNTLE